MTLPSKTLPVPRHLVLLLGVLTAFGPVSVDIYLPAFPQITRDFAAPAGAVQLTLALFLLSISVGQALYGPLADRWGRRAPLLIGCTLYTLGSLVCAVAPSMNVLFAARVLQALGAAAGMVISRAVVRDLFDERASTHIFSNLMLVMGAAPILAPWVGGQLLAFGNWRLIFFLMTGFGVFCLLASAWALPESLPPSRRVRHGLIGVFRTYGTLVGNRNFLGYALVAGCTAGTHFAYLAGVSFVYIDLHGISAQHFGLFFAVNALGLIGAAQLNRLLLRRYASGSILAFALALNMTAGLALAVCGKTGLGGFPALVGLFFVSLSSVGLSFPNLMAAALAPFGRAAGSASSVLGTVQFAVGGLSGALVGLLHDGTAFPMTAMIALCATGGFIALRTMAQYGAISKEKVPVFVLAVPED